YDEVGTDYIKLSGISGTAENTAAFSNLGDGTLYSKIKFDETSIPFNSDWVTNNYWRLGSGGDGDPLSANTTYYFKVQGTNGENTQTAIYGTEARATRIESVTGVGFSTITPLSVKVRPSNVGSLTNLGAGESGWEAEIYNDNEVLESSSSWRQATDYWEGVDLEINTLYYARIKSRNNKGLENDFTEYTTFYTLAATPEAPQLSRSQTYPDEIDLSISAGAQNGNPPSDTDYAIMVSSLTNFTTYWWVENTGTSAPGWNKTFNIASDWSTVSIVLESNTEYYARLIARNIEGTETEVGVTASTITPTSEPVITSAEPMPAPNDPSQIKVDWSGDASEFKIQYSTYYPTEEPDWEGWQLLNDWDVVYTKTETGIDINSARWYMVLGRTSDGFGPSVSTGTTGAWTRATDPSWRTVPLPDDEIGEKSFHIYWSSGANPSYTEYYLAGSTDDVNYSEYQDWKSTIHYNATLLDVNKKYYFKVKAQSGDGAGSPDHGEEVATDWTTVESKYTRIESAADADFNRYVSAITITGISYTGVSWDDPPTRINDGGSGIRYWNITKNQGRNFDDGQEKQLSYTDTGLTPNSTYQYEIQTQNADNLNNTAYTTKIITTSIEIPTGLTFIDITTGSIRARPAPTAYTNLGVSSSAWQVKCETFGVDPSTSGWSVDSATSYFKFSGLEANKKYEFIAQARNRSAEERKSSSIYKWTLAENATIGAARVEGSTKSLTITITEDPGNSADSNYPEYAVCATTNSWTDTWWLNLDGSGFASNSSEVWDKKSNWGDGTDIVVAGLNANSNYTFKVKTRNGDEEYNGDGYSPDVSAYTEIEEPGTIDIISRSTFSVTVEAVSVSEAGNFSNLQAGTTGLYFEEWNTGQDINRTSTTTWECNLSSPNVMGSFQVTSYNGDDLSAGTTGWYDYASLIEPSTAIVFGTINTDSIQVKAGNSFSRLTDVGSGWIIYNITESTDTGWEQTEPAYYTFSGLGANEEYNFKTNSRNREGIENTESQIFTKYTKSNAPAAGEIDEVTENEMTAHWTANSNPQGTEYQAAISTVSNFSVLLDSSSWKVDISSYVFTGLTPNTVYYLQARTGNGDDTESGWTALGDKCTKIESPTGVNYEIWESSTVVTAVGNFTNLTSDGYIQFGKSADGVNWTNSSDLLTESKIYTGLSANTTYQFRIRTKNQTLASINAWVVGPSSATRIQEPEGAQFGVITSSSVELRPSNAASLSDLSVGESGWRAYSVDTSSTSAWRQDTGYVNFSTGMVSNELYKFQLKTRNKNGLENSYSQNYSTYTLCNVPGLSLSKPTEPGAIEVSLSANGNEETSQTTIYNIRLSSAPWGSIWYQGIGFDPDVYETPQDGEYSDFGGGAARKITGLVPGTTYWIGVRARNAALIWTGWSDSETLITRADKPYGLSVTAPAGVTDELDINWSGTGDEFFVQYSTADPAGGGFSTTTWQDLYGAGASWIVTKSTKDMTLSPNEERWYHVKARDAELIQTDYSDEEPGAYSRALQPVDDNYTSISSTGYKVNWTTGTGGNYNPGYTNYEVQIDTCGLFVWENLIDSTTLTGKNYTTDKLEPNGPYYARVRALNEDDIYTEWCDIRPLSSSDFYIYTRIESPEYVGVEIYKSSVTLSAPGTYSRSAGETNFTLYITTPGGTVEDSGWQTSNDWNSLNILTQNSTYQFNIKTKNYENLENAAVSEVKATRIEDSDGVIITQVTPYGIKIRSSGTWTNIGDGESAVRILNSVTDSSSAWSNSDNGSYWWQDTGLDPGKEYSYKVRTRNREGLENQWQTLRTTATLALTAGLPTLTSISTETIKVVIDRGGNAELPGIEYLIGLSTAAANLPDKYVGSDGSTTSVRYWANYTNWGAAAGQVVKDLGINKDYYVRVKVRNSDGVEREWSQVASVDAFARWHFGDGGLDETESGYHLTYSTGATETAGRMGKGLDMDGNFGYGWSSTNTVNGTYNAMTVEAWVKADAVEDLDRLIGNTLNNGVVSNQTFNLYITGTDLKINFAEDGGGNFSAVSDSALTAGEWTHIAGVYNGAHVLLYINGEQQVSSSTLTGNLYNVDNPVTIGAWSDGAGGNASNFFDGVIDEVGIYGSALTPAEILAHYQGEREATKIEEPESIDFAVDSSTYIKVKSSQGYTRLAEGSSGLKLYNTVTATGTGGTGWKQDNNWWEDNNWGGGLDPNTTYTYKLQARNRDGTLTGEIEESTVTLAAVPGAAGLSNASTGTIKIIVDEGNNPLAAETEYVIGISTYQAAAPTYFVQADSTTGGGEVWGTKTGEWGG
ncbi:MAG: hypothetical protein PF545_03140, partial [Elusimicrobia bacterium]|nr:hypothetical protein [Elusimicrobiota bacterium]